jgi:RimJ/RimL family protein N-acetyltransferase
MVSVYPLTLHTPRLLIREMAMSDAEPIWTYSQHPRHRIYEPDPPRSLEAFRGIVQWILNTQSERPRQYYYTVACLKDDPLALVGSVHITVRDVEHRQAEVGYSFNQAYWGAGYATEAAGALVAFAFRDLGMHRVFADSIVGENVASVRVAEKLGMRREATFQESLYFAGRWWNTVLYAVLEHEWR